MFPKLLIDCSFKKLTAVTTKQPLLAHLTRECALRLNPLSLCEGGDKDLQEPGGSLRHHPRSGFKGLAATAEETIKFEH